MVKSPFSTNSQSPAVASRGRPGSGSLAITDAPLAVTAMNSAPARHSGIASAVNNDVARFGGLLAVTALPPLAGISGTAYLNPPRSPPGSGPWC